MKPPGSAGGQLHWSALGTPAMTCWTCWPQPDQVALPHRRHLTRLHMGDSWQVRAAACRWECPGSYTPMGMPRHSGSHRPRAGTSQVRFSHVDAQGPERWLPARRHTPCPRSSPCEPTCPRDDAPGHRERGRPSCECACRQVLRRELVRSLRPGPRLLPQRSRQQSPSLATRLAARCQKPPWCAAVTARAGQRRRHLAQLRRRVLKTWVHGVQAAVVKGDVHI